MTQPEAAQPGPGVATVATNPWPVGPGEQVVLEHVTPARAAMRRFVRHRLAIVGVVIVTFIIIIAILAPFLTTWSPNKVDLQVGSRQPPSSIHILGTDVSGRDIW